MTGVGIWATHFIAMQAFKPNLPTGYDFGLTALSLAAAVILLSLAYLLSFDRRWSAAPAAGGAMVGVAIATMHYLGMSAFQVQRFIVLPIALRLMLPAYSNQAIGMLKGTSLASTITLMELTGVANTIVASTFQPYEVFIMAALIYLTITLVITRCFKYLEYALSKHQRPLKSTAAIPGQVRHAD